MIGRVLPVPTADTANLIPTDRHRLHRLVFVWLLLGPILFFAGHGTFFFENGAGNNLLGGSYSTLATVQSDAESRNQLLELSVIFGFIILVMVPVWRRVTRLLRRNVVFLALMVLTVTSIVWSQFPTTTLRFSIYFIIDTLFAFYLATRFEPREQIELFQMAGWLAIILSLIVVLAMPQYGIDHREGLQAWEGIFPQKNSCAIMVTLFLAGVRFLEPTSLYGKLTRSAYALLALLLIGMSQSRTGWLLCGALMLFVFVFEMALKLSPRTRMLLLFIFLVICIPTTAFIGLNLGSILPLLGKDATFTGRTAIWTAVFQEIMKHPIVGYGFHAFWGRGLNGEATNIALSTGWVLAHSHNGFLDIWLDLGAVGLGLVLLSFLQAFKNAVICLRGKPSRYVGWFIAIVVLTLLGNLDERTLLYPNFLEWIMYIMACVGLANEAKRVNSKELA
jgi:exopolysaccharide production protein ExoQ